MFIIALSQEIFADDHALVSKSAGSHEKNDALIISVPSLLVTSVCLLGVESCGEPVLGMPSV